MYLGPLCRVLAASFLLSHVGQAQVVKPAARWMTNDTTYDEAAEGRKTAVLEVTPGVHSEMLLLPSLLGRRAGTRSRPSPPNTGDDFANLDQSRRDFVPPPFAHICQFSNEFGAFGRCWPTLFGQCWSTLASFWSIAAKAGATAMNSGRLRARSWPESVRARPIMAEIGNVWERTRQMRAGLGRSSVEASLPEQCVCNSLGRDVARFTRASFQACSMTL